MPVSEKTLNRGWVGMGWRGNGLLPGASNNTTHQQLLLVKPSASSQKSCITVGGWVRNFLISVFGEIVFLLIVSRQEDLRDG